MKIKNKTIIPYKGEVIDLCVTNSHTYNVESLAVHNSGGGSLVNYVLFITDLDPIRWELPFARFLNVNRCLEKNTLVFTDQGNKYINDIKVGDQVLTAKNHFKRVSNTFKNPIKGRVQIKVGDQVFHCSLNHKWPVVRDGVEQLVLAKNLLKSDKLILKTE